MNLDELRLIPEPATRAVECARYIRAGREKIHDAHTIRDAAAAELLEAGWTKARVAQLLGVSTPIVTSLAKKAGLRAVTKHEAVKE